MRKILALVLAALFCLVAVAEVPAYEDIEFPEVLPGGIIMADDSFDYSYDDMTQHPVLAGAEVQRHHQVLRR